MKQLSTGLTSLLCAMFALSLAACEKTYTTPAWEWDTPEPADTTSVTNNDKPRYLWVDAAANFPDYANTLENIARDLTLAKDAGFTDIVVDVRPTSGNVLFTTSYAPPVEWLGAWVSGVYTKIERTATWDYLQAFIDAGHALGLRIHASINTFVGGSSNAFGTQGVLYTDPDKQSWATMLNTADGIISTLDDTSTTDKFFDPANADAQAYLCNLLTDLAGYDLDGIILDRCRFDSYQSDFSDDLRAQFEAYLGQSVAAWPEDVMPVGGNERPSPQPTDYQKWLEFRAKVIHDFMAKARQTVKAVNPKIVFGVYVGGWYATYENVGVNWGSPSFDTSAYFPTWATPDYKNYGYADLCDQMLIGAYASADAVYGTNEWTIQGFCSKAMTYTMGACPLVVGGPDIGNWTVPAGWTETDVNNSITESVKACMDACDGYYLFDMIDLKNQPDEWAAVKKGIDIALGNNTDEAAE